MRAAILAAAALATLAGCRSAPVPSDDVSARYMRANEEAVGRFQAVHGHGQRAHPRCVELCNASYDACLTAASLCTHDGPTAACSAAQQGCDWTRTMTPRECRYCLSEDAAP